MNVQPVKIPVNFVNESRPTNKEVKSELQRPVNDIKRCPEFHVPQELIDQLENERQKRPLKNEAKLDIIA